MWSVYRLDSETLWWDWLEDFASASSARDYAIKINRDGFETRIFFESDNYVKSAA
jgi:hypothetical protein